VQPPRLRSVGGKKRAKDEHDIEPVKKRGLDAQSERLSKSQISAKMKDQVLMMLSQDERSAQAQKKRKKSPAKSKVM
jgi:hypothetical protein